MLMRTCEQKRQKRYVAIVKKTSPDWTEPIWFLDSAGQIRSKSAKKNADNKFVVDQCYQI